MEKVDVLAVVISVIAAIAAVVSVLFALWHMREARRLMAEAELLRQAMERGIVVPVDVVVVDRDVLDEVRRQYAMPVSGYL